VSNNDGPDKKPPPQKTVAWDPADVPEFEGDAPVPTEAAPAPPVDPSATVRFTAEDVAKLTQEAAALEAEAPDEDPLIGTLIRDKWKVLKRLGAGSFGTVYKVEDMKGGWIEALKILGVDRLMGREADEMRARFLREAQIMKRLGKDSKHIVGLSTYEDDIEAGLIYFLMEYVDGGSLADALAKDGAFSVERTTRLAIQVCDALMAAHEGPEPVVHRDLKLENLVLATDRSGNEMVKVLDFGIAKITEREADSRLTTVGTLGTPGYAAPEQLRAEEVDGRTDLFAFGVILYALLTGRDPWLGKVAHEPTDQIYELMVATDRAEVRSIAETGASVPPAMVNIVMKLLQRDPAQRFQSARVLRAALESMEEGTAGPETGWLQVITKEPGVQVEIKRGRNVVAHGPTPCTADAIPPGTYSVSIRDPRFEPNQTTVTVTGGGTQDVTLTTESRAAPGRSRLTPKRKSGGMGRLVAAAVVLLTVGVTAYAQPWGRTLDAGTFWAHVDGSRVSAVWLTEGGLEGGILLAPITALESMLAPFHFPASEGDIPELVSRLRSTGVIVDVRWEIQRLTDLATQAQDRGRYFGVDGGDVQSFALRMRALVPESQEATSLLLKVGEHMAWDAEAALAAGLLDEATVLIRDCLALVSQHSRCVEVSESL
jgi:serine/threonine protein kinase